jgi:hypothetical protein
MEAGFAASAIGEGDNVSSGKKKIFGLPDFSGKTSKYAFN